ncbi:hypothetical protein QTH87_04655 [Variovorax sp. J22P168]|uniref:hypothetical protein n=1 Tax=Variovorax jilinensis TaxID=3053513 RepID=UPI002577401D|nr:hypothetical protein [Variovorax sp. J22P168]MDM0011722.1 hypothetical protein [Variovorax sp. J22P168]
MVKKIQLNDEQWKTLQFLLEAASRQAATAGIQVPDRLWSNGFVAIDPHGSKLLTLQGRERLSQGR